MEMTRSGTINQSMMPCDVYMEILWVHKVQGPEIRASRLQDMYIHLGFSPKAAKLLIREQELDSPERLKVLVNKNVDNICIVVRKPGGKNVNGTPDRGQQVSVKAQESLKLAVFLFHHRWRCTLNWEKMGVNEDTLHSWQARRNLKISIKTPMCCQRTNLI